MAKKIKLTRKQMKQPDEFLNWSEAAWEWVEENLAYAIGTLVAGVAIILLVQWGLKQMLTSQDPAATELAAAADVLNKPILSKSDPRLSDGYASEADRNQAASDEFKGFIRKHPDSKYADMALVYLARTQEDMKDYAAAIETYQKLSATNLSLTDPSIKQIAIMGMARSEFATKKYQAALDHYKQIADSDSIFKLDAFIGAARCHAYLGDQAAAKEFLAKARDQFPDSWEARDTGFLAKYWASELDQEGKGAESTKEKEKDSVPKTVEGATIESPKPTGGGTAEPMRDSGSSAKSPSEKPENPTPAPTPPEPEPASTAK
jgi:tetratricopeptide (TPR) repeat protein